MLYYDGFHLSMYNEIQSTVSKMIIFILGWGRIATPGLLYSTVLFCLKKDVK